MFGKLLKSVFKKCPLDEIIEKTVFFLRPQLVAMSKLEGNKYGLITYDSLFYMLAIAEEIGGRKIVNDEGDTFFLTILGDDYKQRIDKILDDVRSDRFNDHENVVEAANELKIMARDDVKNGMFNCSNFLLENAQYLSDWQKSVRGLNA